jgi:hypothetical protein
MCCMEYSYDHNIDINNSWVCCYVLETNKATWNQLVQQAIKIFLNTYHNKKKKILLIRRSPETEIRSYKTSM